MLYACLSEVKFEYYEKWRPNFCVTIETIVYWWDEKAERNLNDSNEINAMWCTIPSTSAASQVNNENITVHSHQLYFIACFDLM